MPSLYLELPGRPPRIVKLVRTLTTVGSSTDNDICIAAAGLEPTHAQIQRENNKYVIIGMLRDMTVNGRRDRRATLAHGDVVRFGNLTVTYYHRDHEIPRSEKPNLRAVAGRPETVTHEIVAAYRKVHEFSMKLLENESTGALVDTLLDAIVELTGADKGFLVLVEDEGRLVARAARKVDRQDIQRSLDQLSDSILRRVLETRRPLIVADALSDEEWSASESVINLKLLSVMCCPLLNHGELTGLLYVGNNRVTNVFDGSSLDVMNVFAAQASLLLSQARRMDDLAKKNDALTEQLEGLKFGRIVGACDSMQAVFKRVRKVATTDVSVLVTGETGTGKELVAREVHEGSHRAQGPFVVVNCGAIPENLLESELFGHVRGAFTGAVADKMGRFQAAHGGTLFLDEIGEMPMSLQVKLLRALQEHVVTRVGDTQSERVDIRVVAATNRKLDEEIRAGRFREDLFYRLNVVNVVLPPLRDRGDDLAALARYFLARDAEELGRSIKGFTKSAVVAMRKYRWPGNIRELENRIKKAVVLAERNLLTAADLDIEESDIEDVLPLAEAKERFQIRYINRVLEMNAGNRTKTARDLGVDPRTVFRHLEKLNASIPPEDGRVGLEVDPLTDRDPPRP